MGEMAKFPYLTGRKGSGRLYYKRMVPLELRGEGRPAQIWRSLGTADRKIAEAAYGARHVEVEALFAQWRQYPMPIAHQPGSEPIEIPEQIPNPAVRPATPTRPEPRPEPKEPVKVPQQVPAGLAG
jgi:hypothetical protein